LPKNVSPNATRVTDRFHVQKLALGALQEIRIKYRRQAIDQENEAMEKAKLSKKRFKPILLANHDTIKQLLARSRYFLYKNKSKWSKNQTERAEILFELYPDIKRVYDLAQDLRNIFEKTTDKVIGLSRLAR
jgi:transposase